MSPKGMEDPIHPKVTFDSYVIPETVQSFPSDPADAPGFQVNGTVVSVALISVLAFLLGVLGTLQFTSGSSNTATFVPVATEPAASETEAVTRLRTPNLLDGLDAENETASGEDALASAVLQGLQPKRTVGRLTEQERIEKSRETQAIVSRNKLRMLREGVLAGVYKITAKQEDGKNRLVLETINAGMTQKATANLLLEAAKRGDIEIPASLSTAEGEIDLDTLLFNLIQNSLATDGTAEGLAAAREMSRRAFAASSAKTRVVGGDRLYTVERGDSLAYISLQFYGRPNAFMRIFEANRDVLSSPDRIRTGQRLKIPG